MNKMNTWYVVIILFAAIVLGSLAYMAMQGGDDETGHSYHVEYSSAGDYQSVSGIQVSASDYYVDCTQYYTEDACEWRAYTITFNAPIGTTIYPQFFYISGSDVSTVGELYTFELNEHSAHYYAVADINPTEPIVTTGETTVMTIYMAVNEDVDWTPYYIDHVNDWIEV